MCMCRCTHACDITGKEAHRAQGVEVRNTMEGFGLDVAVDSESMYVLQQGVRWRDMDRVMLSEVVD